MSKIKFFSILIILFLSFQICFGQEKLTATLVQEIAQPITQEFYTNMIDVLIQDLKKNPNQQGYVIIYPGKDSAKHEYSLEKNAEYFTKAIISLRKFDKTRINIIQGKEKDIFTVELWKALKSEKVSFPVENHWSQKPRNLTKPFVFGGVYIDEVFPNFIPEFYADYLKANPNLRGYIVIFNLPRKEALIESEKWQKILTEEYQVPLNQLKVFVGKNNSNSEAEFWLVPGNKIKKSSN